MRIKTKAIILSLLFLIIPLSASAYGYITDKGHKIYFDTPNLMDTFSWTRTDGGFTYADVESCSITYNVNSVETEASNLDGYAQTKQIQKWWGEDTYFRSRHWSYYEDIYLNY